VISLSSKPKPYFFALVAATVITLSSCYQGVAGSEELQILQTEMSSNQRVAMLVERCDHAALSGNTLFVLISDHVYPLPELRKRIYGLHPVFMSGRDGISIHWSGPDELTIRCLRCDLKKAEIEKQEFRQGKVSIKYLDFPSGE
jgi:hypothetical protein